ncbi:hypothetical protein V499_01504 [Pseudogymnoascus sp. VKM F-103]|uniref:Uncharacterized protein n=1 Tax=Pseudogymnoascus verrucosus TaxID=342668 RepID=A0A1B8G9P0_9PEZI|nr:uncharacterized protein VE01_09662 [Pseudogymnoascus verrucosus]KFY79529.1 hypothetical protein V499_01504 [Pseudogymnoascus sp. VKM F-103]OBT92558.1 hypothetical protein VE01_09662 [Pseudogymnoascus verrucosus]
MPLHGVGLVLTVCGAACVFGFLGGLAQRCYMEARSRSRAQHDAREAARRDANRGWPSAPADIELGPRRPIVWLDGQLAAQTGVGRGRVFNPDAEAIAANGREERGGLGWTTV